MQSRYINSKNLGFMQGRLVNSPYNKIQCFPDKEWKKELLEVELIISIINTYTHIVYI